MSVPDDKKGETPLENQTVSTHGEATPPLETEETGVSTDDTSNKSGTESINGDAAVSYEQTTDYDYDSHYRPTYEDPYSHETYPPPASDSSTSTAVATSSTSGGSGTPPPPASESDEDADEDGMLRMSFMEHLEELRSRIIKVLIGVALAFGFAIIFAESMWKAVSAPAIDALRALGQEDKLAQLTPMDGFTTIYMKLPLLAAIFLSSPWVIYQVWSFIAPGLYQKERRFAAPVIISTAGLFILGGSFAYFVAFRFGLEFLLGIGNNMNVKPVISIVDYFDLFVNVTLGIGLVFEMPIAIFFLSLLGIVSAKFLVQNSRYAILIIVIIAAFVTPTPDVFNLMLFAVPMVLLYFVGVFAAYLLELRRDKKGFPWLSVLVIIASLIAVSGAIIWALVARYGYKVVPNWPFLIR